MRLLLSHFQGQCIHRFGNDDSIRHRFGREQGETVLLSEERIFDIGIDEILYFRAVVHHSPDITLSTTSRTSSYE